MAVNPSKDVDGFHPENFGKMAFDVLLFPRRLMEF
jgi:methylenetetrahydrofolate dehydrogenase (NADP+)/methenyltetrahydrofolate cyclohydrolase